MKIISFDQIKKLQIQPLECYSWVEECIKTKNQVLLPAKISMKPSEGTFCNVMPCILNNGYGGVKIVTRYPERIPSLDSRLILFDAMKGDFLALMDADWITTMRTGAVAAHSIKLLAKPDFTNISILGLGNTARATLLVLLSLYPKRKFSIKLLAYKGQEESFIKRFCEFSNVSFSIVYDYKTLIKMADVVISAVTYFSNDICEDSWFDEGVTVVPIHTRGFTNCDLFFDKVYADDVGHVKHFKNFSKFRYFSEVSDVVTNVSEGRISDRERIIVYNIGIAMHDVYFGSRICQLLAGQISKSIELSEPNEKFWV